MSVSKTLSIFIFVQAVCAAAASPRLDLFRRQSQTPSGADLPPLTQIPSQCQASCSGPIATLTSCTPPQPSCICVKSFQMGLFNCYSCLGQAAGATNYTIPQQSIDGLTQACDQAGSPLPELTFPGESSARPLSTIATATNSVTVPATGTSSFNPIVTTQSLITQTVPTAVSTRLPGSSSPSIPNAGATQTVSTTTGGNSTGGNGAYRQEASAALCAGAVAVIFFLL